MTKLPAYILQEWLRDHPLHCKDHVREGYFHTSRSHTPLHSGSAPDQRPSNWHVLKASPVKVYPVAQV